MTTYYADPDGDGWGNPDDTAEFCGEPDDGYVANVPDNCPHTLNPDQTDSDEDGANTVRLTPGDHPCTRV